jgi:hypothetical protein
MQHHPEPIGGGTIPFLSSFATFLLYPNQPNASLCMYAGSISVTIVPY